MPSAPDSRGRRRRKQPDRARRPRSHRGQHPHASAGSYARHTRAGSQPGQLGGTAPRRLPRRRSHERHPPRRAARSAVPLQRRRGVLRGAETVLAGELRSRYLPRHLAEVLGDRTRATMQPVTNASNARARAAPVAVAACACDSVIRAPTSRPARENRVSSQQRLASSAQG